MDLFVKNGWLGFWFEGEFVWLDWFGFEEFFEDDSDEGLEDLNLFGNPKYLLNNDWPCFGFEGDCCCCDWLVFGFCGVVGVCDVVGDDGDGDDGVFGFCGVVGDGDDGDGDGDGDGDDDGDGDGDDGDGCGDGDECFKCW